MKRLFSTAARRLRRPRRHPAAALLLSLLLCSAGCSEKVDVFYSTDYPILRVDAAVTLLASDEEQDEGQEGVLTAEEQALVEALCATVLREAPVAAGGSYRLDFNRADGGNLYVSVEEGDEPVAGSFTKVPASSELTFEYAEMSYTARLSSYDEEGRACVRFAIDLTDDYRERFGLEQVASIVRYEYTSHLTD